MKKEIYYVPVCTSIKEGFHRTLSYKGKFSEQTRFSCNDLPLEYRFIAANNFKKRKRFGVISGEVLKEYNFIPCDDIHKYCDLLQADNVDVLSDIKNKKEMLENAFNGLVPMQIGTSYYDVTLEKSKVKEL